MTDFYLTAFLFGLAGSFHCVGMCGPVMLAIPMDLQTKVSILIDSLIFNTGRIFTYGFIGLIFSLLGMSLQGFNGQQYLSIGAGILMLILYFGVGKNASFSEKFWLTRFLRQNFSKLLQNHSPKSLFLTGLLTGFLPCGLVYAAASGAILSGTPENGILYMMSFGVGTIPLMLAVSFSRSLLKDRVKIWLKASTPYLVSIVAILMIVRGLGLGIPYLSPVAESLNNNQIQVECCDIPEEK